MENTTTKVAPKKGEILNIATRNLGACRVIKVWPFGTMDVEVLKTGTYLRITGLGWLSVPK